MANFENIQVQFDPIPVKIFDGLVDRIRIIAFEDRVVAASYVQHEFAQVDIARVIGNSWETSQLVESDASWERLQIFDNILKHEDVRASHCNLPSNGYVPFVLFGHGRRKDDLGVDWLLDLLYVIVVH